MKRLNKILSAVQKFASKDYAARHINGIKFDMVRQTVEATDGHGAIIIKGSRGFVAGMANDYAEYLGLDPVGSDFDIVKLAPKNGKKFPVAERLPEEDNRRGDLHPCLRFGEHDPEGCSSAIVCNDQFPRLNALCKALKTTLHLVPGTTNMAALMQYGKSSYNGEEILFCIAQMPCYLSLYDENGTPKTTTVTYSPMDETERDAMKQFTKGKRA
jgi:hypothetical protein